MSYHTCLSICHAPNIIYGILGMNVVNGYEEAEGIFELVVLGSCLFGGGFLGGCYSYLNGSRSHQRTLDSLSEIEVMNRALGDMSAVSRFIVLSVLFLYAIVGYVTSQPFPSCSLTTVST